MLPRSRRAIGALAVTALVLVAGVIATREGAAAQPVPPDVVVILTDDQRWDTLSAMPTVQAELQQKGVTFSNAFVSNPLCCPSRASILTGTYSHTNGVYSNGGENGGFDSFIDSSTVATWLQDAGYRTGLVGKYLNQYHGTYVPPGWDRWAAIRTYHYFDYSLIEDGVRVRYGSSEEEYQTDVLANHAEDFIRGTPAAEPLFLYFAPFAPHMPATSAPRYEATFADLPKWRPPSYNELRIEDKPAYIQAIPRLDRAARRIQDEERRSTFRSLLPVDDAVERIVDALSDTGRLQNTLLIFTSDNGYEFGEHRWGSKIVPYNESLRVPMIVRFDGLPPTSATEDRYVLNVDLAPTIADLAGITPPTAIDGESFWPVIEGAPGPAREDFLVEHAISAATFVPTYCGVRSEEFLYVVYSTGERELYDVVNDPFELHNLASRPLWQPTVDTLQQRLEVLCDPLPPDFQFPVP